MLRGLGPRMDGRSAGAPADRQPPDKQVAPAGVDVVRDPSRLKTGPAAPVGPCEIALAHRLQASSRTIAGAGLGLPLLVRCAAVSCMLSSCVVQLPTADRFAGSAESGVPGTHGGDAGTLGPDTSEAIDTAEPTVDTWVPPRTCETGCASDNPCLAGSCDTRIGQCVWSNTTSSCDDGDACTADDVCSDGSCKGDPSSCDDDNPCTVDACAAQVGCKHVEVFWSNRWGGEWTVERGKAIAPIGEDFLVGGQIYPDDQMLDAAPTVARITVDGALVWQKTIGPTSGYGIANRGAAAVTGGVVFSGYSGKSEAADCKLWKVDGDGNVVWDRTIGKPGYSDRCLGVAAFGSGGLVAAGWSAYQSQGGDDFWLVFTDGFGNTMTEWKSGTAKGDELYDVAAKGESFAAVGGQAAGGWLGVGTSSGKVTQQKNWSNGTNDGLYAVTAAPTGWIASGSKMYSSGWMIAVDTTGSKLLWEKVYDNVGIRALHDAVVLPDGSLFVVAMKLNYDAWFARLGFDGGLLLDTALPNYPGNAELNSLALVPKGGAILVGTALGDSPERQQYWTLRVDSWGHASCSASGACASKSTVDCDDGNSCTIESCTSGGGCQHTPSPGGCN